MNSSEEPTARPEPTVITSGHPHALPEPAAPNDLRRHPLLLTALRVVPVVLLAIAAIAGLTVLILIRTDGLNGQGWSYAGLVLAGGAALGLMLATFVHGHEVAAHQHQWHPGDGTQFRH